MRLSRRLDRQVTKRELGISKSMAGVDMRLNAGSVRELHWHKAAEWAFMLYGTARITAVDPKGTASSTTSASAISGIFQRALPTPFRDSVRTAANFFWF